MAKSPEIKTAKSGVDQKLWLMKWGARLLEACRARQDFR